MKTYLSELCPSLAYLGFMDPVSIEEREMRTILSCNNVITIEYKHTMDNSLRNTHKE